MIESQWNLLQERVEASKDFTELARFHQEYEKFSLHKITILLCFPPMVSLLTLVI